MARLHGGIKAREIMYRWYMAFLEFNPLQGDVAMHFHFIVLSIPDQSDLLPSQRGLSC
jgi:hypothetical protein